MADIWSNYSRSELEAYKKMNTELQNSFKTTGKQAKEVIQKVSDELNDLLIKASKDTGKANIQHLETFLDTYKTAEERLDHLIGKGTDFLVDQSIAKEREAELDEQQSIRRERQTNQLLQLQTDLVIEYQKINQLQGQINDKAFANIDLTDLRISKEQEVVGVIQKEQEAHRTILEDIALASTTLGESQDISIAGDLRAVKIQEDAKAKAERKLIEDTTAYRAKLEAKAIRKNKGELSAEEATAIEKEYADRLKFGMANIKALAAEQLYQDAEREAAAMRRQAQQEQAQQLKALTDGDTRERRKALHDLTTDDSGNFALGKALLSAIAGLSNFAKQLENKINDIASYKSYIDTQLQGSSNERFMKSYWDQMVRDMTSLGSITYYYKQEDFAGNIKALVERGIAFDLEQRAFLETIQGKIANTFDVADGTLLRLIRIQQEDSTAGRLGMESALTAFLNSMYENTEYLHQVASSVRSSLAEMESMMSGRTGAEVEYQVQKWLGSLYSVGMSESAVSGISTVLGQIGSGQIEGVTSGGASNLLIMAASDAGLSIADLLTSGLDASETNKLMQAVVNYLADLAESSKDNNVVQQQLAKVFGVTASDLRAATNLVSRGTTQDIYESSLTYSDMISRLYEMAGTMGTRTSMGEKMTNIWSNFQYSLAGSIADNPISYFLYTMASTLEDVTGGIPVPFVNALGSGVDLETTVADILRVSALGTGILGSLGPLVSGLTSSFSGQAMLSELGITSGANLTVTPRGNIDSFSAIEGGGVQTTSGSAFMTSNTFIGNASGSDVRAATMAEASDTKKRLMIEAKEEAEANQIDSINTTVLKIYELLDNVTNGSAVFNVKVEGYGLTNATGGGGAGVASASARSGGSGFASEASLSGSGVASALGVTGNVSLGGWTTTV